MDKNTSTLFKIYKDTLLFIITLINEKDQLALARVCTESLGIFKEHFKQVDCILLCNPDFNQRSYINRMKGLFGDYWKIKTGWSRGYGWNRTEFRIRTYNFDNVNSCEYPFVSNAVGVGVCLEVEEPFKFPDWTLKYVERISHIALGFRGNSDTASSISFLKQFPNVVSISLIGAKFNDDIFITISNLPLLRSLHLCHCETNNYLSKIASACNIEIFELSKCKHSKKEITPPPKSRELRLDYSLNYSFIEDTTNLSACNDIIKL
jgi:hypothetical protein